jgi:hypothetical protein
MMRNHRLLPWWMGPFLGAVLSACGALPGRAEIQPMPAPAYEVAPAYLAVPEDSVQMHEFTEPLPVMSVSVAQFTLPDSMESHTDEQVIAAYRPQAARLGATWITVDPSNGRRRVVAYRVPSGVRIRRVRESADTSTGTTATPSSSSGSGSVQVRGYRRRDGTYVRPHTRSRPRSRH